MRRGKGQNAERRPSRFHSLASLCNNNYSRRLPAARNNLAQWKSSPQTRQRFRSIALSRPQSSCIITRGFHDCWFHSITVNTNDCRYHCARLLNARQNQNGREERERERELSSYCLLQTRNNFSRVHKLLSSWISSLPPLFGYQHRNTISTDHCAANDATTFHLLFHFSPPNWWPLLQRLVREISKNS